MFCLRDHPRLHGEHPAREAPPPPLARIIPACAGSTIRCRMVCEQIRDHPRLRGEHPTQTTLSRVESGSSPLARGAPRGLAQPHRARGIIPACAGSTRSGSPRPSCSWDHPRLRGEHDPVRLIGVVVWGSSPLARGARQARGGVFDAGGIIPACAGSTWRGRSP